MTYNVLLRKRGGNTPQPVRRLLLSCKAQHKKKRGKENNEKEMESHGVMGGPRSLFLFGRGEEGGKRDDWTGFYKSRIKYPPLQGHHEKKKKKKNIRKVRKRRSLSSGN